MLIEHPAISEYFSGNAFSADDLFAGLPAEAQNKLFRVKHKKQFAKGEMIFASGQTPAAIYFLREGEAKLLHYADRVVRAVDRNEILGLTEAITDLPYETGLKAFSPCAFEYIDRADFIRFLQTEPDVCFRLLQMLGTNIQKLFRLFH